jgi:hypothetical protein
MTEDQRKDNVRFRRYIEREDLRQMMNSTKWREVIAALRAIPAFEVNAQFRVKDVRGEPDPDWYWDRSFPWHVPTYVTIEWLDIHPTPGYAGMPPLDFTESIVEALRSVNVPFSFVGDFIRIWGYLRPGDSPEFA